MSLLESYDRIINTALVGGAFKNVMEAGKALLFRNDIEANKLGDELIVFVDSLGKRMLGMGVFKEYDEVIFVLKFINTLKEKNKPESTDIKMNNVD